MADDGNKKAIKALAIAENYDRTISVILIGNNVVNIAAASAATAIATTAFGVSGVAVSTAVMTVVILVFGEVLPKSLAKGNAEKTVFMFGGFLGVIIVLLSPIAWLFVKLQLWAARLCNSGTSPLVTEQELISIIEASEEEGVIDQQRSTLMQSVMSFDNTTVQEILTPRVDLVAIEIGDNKEEILAEILAERFSRMPVYEKTQDNIIGILHTRDYLEASLAGVEIIDIRAIMTKPIFVHKTQKISALLSLFKRDHIHMAVVMDDYGGTMGIVSMEDLLEELVGEIYDEDDEIDRDFYEIKPSTYSVSGDFNVYETLEQIGYEERDFESEYPTLGGWALEILERVPNVGDGFGYNGIDVVVTEMDDQRIMRLSVTYISEN